MTIGAKILNRGTSNSVNTMSDNIVYVVGGNSWVPSYVSLYSLLRNNPTRGFKIHIFSEEEKNDFFFNNIPFLKNVHDEFKISFHRISEQEYNKLPSPRKKRLPKGFFIKIILPKILDTNCESFLYLDADTLIVDEIDALMELDINDYVLAAAPDYNNLIAGLNTDLKKRYFNAGVLKINPEKWEKNEVTSKTIRYIKKIIRIWMTRLLLMQCYTVSMQLKLFLQNIIYPAAGLLVRLQHLETGLRIQL